MEYKQQARESVFCFFRVVNTFLIFITYLSLPSIKLIEIEWLKVGEVGGMCLIGFGAALFLQIIVGVMYNKQLFLKVQFLLYRNVLFYIGVLSLSSLPNFSTGYVLLIAFSMISLFGMSLMIGKESYSKHLLKN